MSEPKVKLCADGHYRHAIYGLGPYIADYPEQVLLACIVQGWFQCMKDLDGSGDSPLRTHEHTCSVMKLASDILWKEYGIVDNILPFTFKFSRANIHELLASDILHQLIKGTFKDSIVTWVETYFEITWGKAKAKSLMDEIDKR
ncbi:hypothetical protein SCLCIDRAFT_126119 [Scleroderma citrinum Foug A]|uniref:Uncharacterized protein n=1 Tax=Scleroderma citrinum Foug A TaxID=1036808 RepID=A0A0C3A472_9AGAM|nr:hypothetical protein SCLCIDRAFT_126119 [Scleroderma citrinum Foug A]